MPPLYQLDNFEECMAHDRAAFCIGSFELVQHRNDGLLKLIQQYSTNPHHFNHTRINRGYCLHNTCSHIKGSSLSQRFERCVNNLTRSSYGLETNLTDLQYCRRKKQKRVMDDWDLGFMYLVGVILAFNLIGTLYDLLRSDKEPIKPLLAWSLVVNWKRLTADHRDGDQRLSALRPIHGMKVLTLLLVMMAHSVFGFHLTYLYNPRFFEISSKEFLASYFQNGTTIVQTFILISSFLLAYNLLIYAGDNPKKPLSIKMLPMSLIHRITRITPLYLFILGLATSWWAHAGAGPLWAPLVESEVRRCRHKWWAQALYVNNLIKGDENCLVHTWFLAVDMQVYVVCACLTVVLGRWTRSAVKVLFGILLASIAVNFTIIYYWKLVPMLKLMMSETMRNHFAGEPSFQWLYQGPWNSLPTALIGLLTAFIHYNQQIDNCKPAENMWVRLIYRLSVPCMFMWVVCGYFMRPVTDALWLSLYATLERPVFAAMTAVAMFGFFHEIDYVWRELLSWRGWEILSRMSLSIYLVHWLLSLLLIATRNNISSASVFDIGEHWLGTIFLSLCAALPLHLLVEVPTTKFLQSLILDK